jgi:hypothetical protein
VDCLADDWRDVVELLPFTYERVKYWAIYLTETCDCLDMERSEFWTTPNVDSIRKFAFVPDRISDKLLFRLPGGYQYYCTNRFKNLVRQHGLTGLRFRRVWADGKYVEEAAESVVAALPKLFLGKKGKPTKRDKLLAALWTNVINSSQGEDRLQEWLTGEFDPDPNMPILTDAQEVARVAIQKGLTVNDLQRMIRSLAYELVFETLVTIEEAGEAKAAALKGLHEDLLMAGVNQPAADDM